MTLHGVVLDALNPAGCPDPRLLAMCGLNGGRLVAFRDQRFVDYQHTLEGAGAGAGAGAGFETAVVLAGESFTGAADDLSFYASAIHPTVWVIGNEQDAWMLGVESPSSWSMLPAEYGVLFARCATTILAVQPAARLVLGGFVAGQPTALGDYLKAIRQTGYTGPIHGFDLHPYGKSAAEAVDLFAQYDQYVEPGMWGYALEINRPANEIAEYEQMLGDTNWCWFCLSDGMVPGFGLLDTNGWPTPALHALRRVL